MTKKREKMVIYFTKEGEMAYPFNIIRHGQRIYLLSYLDFLRLASKKGISGLICRGKSYLGQGIFKKGWQYDYARHRLISYPDNIKSDIIYNRGSWGSLKTEKGVKVLNYPEFEDICHDKYRTYRLFPEYSPKTHLVKNRKELQEQIKKIPSTRAALKPRVGMEGRAVEIHPKDWFKKYALPKGEYILQEFLDTKPGILNLVKGYHDLRILIFNGRPNFPFIRQPKRGSFLANVARGGSLSEIEMSNIPQSIMKPLKNIDGKLAKFSPRFYSADFGYANDRWYLFELNSQPGMSYPEEKNYRQFHQKLLEIIISVL